MRYNVLMLPVCALAVLSYLPKAMARPLPKDATPPKVFSNEQRADWINQRDTHDGRAPLPAIQRRDENLVMPRSAPRSAPMLPRLVAIKVQPGSKLMLCNIASDS